MQPFRFGYGAGRLATLKTLGTILISPFGRVRFRHFFLADILCSMVQPMKDVGYIGCYFAQDGWREQVLPTTGNCPPLQDYLFAVAFIPYWFRFS